MMQAVMEKTRATEDVRHFIDTHHYASEYFIDADALHADGATVEAFKTYLDRKLLNARVDRFEDDIHLFYGIQTENAQLAGESLGWNAVDLEYQPWFRRYFSSVISYEPGSSVEDVFHSLDEWDAKGWNHESDLDDFFPKN